ncbi:hypothetical protein [Labedella endophytica]|uniref:Uncharacterized protein n=1 Tax=Labedella endophytica TaxID=1523160 RepID=A0A433JWM3_9MICO|nr:hypothetical protein [Labedella endophytica]RUR03398.1 hypothetical protein ELQ94_02315 [Labedella endophytica]
MAEWTKQDRLIGIVSVVVAFVGLVLFAIAVSTPVSFGWFASAGVPDDIFTSDDFVMLRHGAVTGAVLFAAGLVGIAFVLGIRRGAGRR